MLPQARPGQYYVIVRANYQQDVFEGVNQYNNSRASSGTLLIDLPSFIPGGVFTGSFQQAGDARYFELILSTKQDVSIELSGPQGAVTELYVRRGELPTEQDFQWRSVIAGATNQSLSLNDAVPGSYFVMVTASNLATPGDFNLSARTSEFSIRGVRPQRGGGGGKVTVTIDGALFDGSSRARIIDSSGKAVEASHVYFANSGAIAATFDLTGSALGMADVQVVTGTGVTTTLSRGFEIVGSVPGTLSAAIEAPSAVRVGRDFKVYVDYRNVGLQDLVAPILRLRVPASVATVGLSEAMADASSDLWMVGVNADMPAGILPPGASGRITIFGRASAGGSILYSLDLSVVDPQKIDWPALKSSLRPPGLSEAEWNLVFAEIQAVVGEDWEDYGRVISEAANLLTPLRGAPSSLVEIFQLIVDQAQATLRPSVSGFAFLVDGNHPLPNARLTLWDAGTDTLVNTVTLSDGRYLFPDVSPGTYSLAVEGYSMGQPVSVTVGTGDVVVPNIIASERPYAIAGRVFTLPDGMPAAEQLVAAVESSGVAYTTVTGEDGSYRIEGLPAGAFTVMSSDEFLGRAQVSGILLEPGKEIQTVNLALSAGASISGTLTGYTGAFPAGSSVYALDQTGRVRGSSDVTPAGAYTIKGLAEGVYEVFTNVPGTVRQGAQGVAVAAFSFVTGIDLALTGAGSVEGTLSVAGGGTLPYQFITVMAGDTFSKAGMSDGQGHFNIPGLAPGTYSVRASVIGYLPAEAAVMFAAGGTATVDLVVSPAAVIRGTVVDGEDNPVIGAAVTIRGTDGKEAWTVTKDAGSYEIGDLLPGTYGVYVGNPDSGALTAERTVVAESGTPAQADFTVPSAGRVTGVVFDADGTTPIAGATVQLFKDGLPVGSTATGENGVYEMQLLTQGTFSVAVLASGKSFALATDLLAEEGSGTVVVDFTAGARSKTGQILFEQTGKPVSAASVFVYQQIVPGAYELVSETVSDTQGNFLVIGLAPGRYLAAAEKAGWAFAEMEFDVEQQVLRSPMDYNPGDSVTLSVGPSASITGQILNESGQPLGGAEVKISYADGDRILASGSADESGHYTINGLPGGSYDVFTSAPGHTYSKTPVITAPGGSANLDSALLLSKAGVAGHVMVAGRPVPYAAIVARDSRNRPMEARVTGKDGTFELNQLIPGNYGMVITSEGNSPTTNSVDIPPDVIISHQEEVIKAANDPNSPMNQFLREFDKNIEWLRNLGPRGIEWVYATAYKVEKDKRHPSIVPDAALDYCKPHRAYALRMTQWADEQFKLWQEAQMNSMSTVANAERAAQWLILGKEVALLFIPVAEKLVKLDKTLKTMKRLQNVQRWYSFREKYKNISDWAQYLNNLNNFVKGLSALYDKMARPVPTDPEQRRDQADGFVADMNDLAGLANGHATQWAEASTKLKEFEAELKLAGQATSEVLFVLGELSGILSVAMQAETAYKEWFEIGKNIAESNKSYEDRRKEYLGAVNNAYNAIIMLQLCNKGLRIPPPKPPRSSSIATSSSDSLQALDPNEKTGPAGWGPQGFIQAGTMTYHIDFENDPKFATAPAQEVFVTDVLDEDLDLNTLTFLSFGFSNRVFQVPAGLARYRTTVDLRPARSLVVDVSLTLDPQTRQVSATFRSLDPQTGRLTEDPHAGFLPVNQEQHEGEGFVEFSIRTRKDLANGAEIRNQAEIVFDVNQPILTNEVMHTLDSGSPVSRVGALPSAVPSRRISLDLSGSDPGGSSVQYFDIYVSDNGGPFTYWMTTNDLSVEFIGECGHRYAFYSVAVDSVGNAEAHPTVADVTTEVLAVKGDTDGGGAVDLADVILTLQMMNKAIQADLDVNICADVNSDGKIGVEEAIFILQKLGGNR
ncbi:MAG: carboxypeptidase regulatory-like domain-containing protein [Desulfobacterota bacterium]|nr:carboxypeptidase regulatory-like domain-containing protein [Thermodesulfobacteriota bacterium]